MYKLGVITQKTLKSVGFDIGTSTTHVVFSELTLEKSSKHTQKFEVKKRKILYSSPIYSTPLYPNRELIDVSRIRQIFQKIYADAGISLENVDTGAVIITGETARKENVYFDV